MRAKDLAVPERVTPFHPIVRLKLRRQIQDEGTTTASTFVMAGRVRRRCEVRGPGSGLAWRARAPVR